MKTYFKIWFIVLLLGCLSESSFAQSNVWISGKLNYEQEGTIKIDNGSYTIFAFTPIANTFVNKSGYFHFKLNITKPQIVLLFNKPLYITPGDSVFANVTGGSFYFPQKLEFRGRNVNNYIYAMRYDSLKTALNYKFFEYDFKNRLIKYLDLLNANKKILLNFLNDFSKSHVLSDNFKAYALNQIIYAYYEQLLFPITQKNYPLEQVPPSYSSILDQIKLTNDSLTNRMEYEYTAINLIEYKKKSGNIIDLQSINENATGRTKELLLTHYASMLISTYESKDSLVTTKLFEKIDKEVIDPEIREYYNSLKDLLNKYLNPFPKEVLLTALVDSMGHKLTFKDLLEKSKNKIIVLDFWASWCGPCRIGMPKVNKVKQELNNPNVEFIFISLDETEKDWRVGLKMTKVPGKHYWINNNFNSALAKYLTIHPIPRYVIINRSGKLEKANAFSPYPGEYGLEAQISKLLNPQRTI